MKKAAIISGKILLGVVAFFAIYLAAAFIASRITISKTEGAAEDIAIYIKSNGVHTDIVVPVRTPQIDWSREVLFANTGLRDTASQYLALGWGDKGFYLNTPTWADLKFSTAFNAAFGLSTTAIHATYYKAMTEGAQCRKMLISREQYASLITFMRSSFQADASGHLVNIITKANYGISDAFYEAKGRYSLFYTCNTWANSALKACGQRCCLWTIFDTPIFAKYSPG
ncbi:MAG: TIGR02117 family protein [Bacteroidota bacterium]